VFGDAGSSVTQTVTQAGRVHHTGLAAADRMAFDPWSSAAVAHLGMRPAVSTVRRRHRTRFPPVIDHPSTAAAQSTNMRPDSSIGSLVGCGAGNPDRVGGTGALDRQQDGGAGAPVPSPLRRRSVEPAFPFAHANKRHASVSGQFDRGLVGLQLPGVSTLRFVVHRARGGCVLGSSVTQLLVQGWWRSTAPPMATAWPRPCACDGCGAGSPRPRRSRRRAEGRPQPPINRRLFGSRDTKNLALLCDR
jgi:hypothetical protein